MLEVAIREILENNARHIYDLDQSLEHSEAIWCGISMNSLAEEPVRRSEYSGRGPVIAGIHLSGFNSVLMSLMRQGPEPGFDDPQPASCRHWEDGPRPHDLKKSLSERNTFENR
jgi:hypothetical protein